MFFASVLILLSFMDVCKAEEVRFFSPVSSVGTSLSFRVCARFSRARSCFFESLVRRVLTCQ